jgi:hypothetical protein
VKPVLFRLNLLKLVRHNAAALPCFLVCGCLGLREKKEVGGIFSGGAG